MTDHDLIVFAIRIIAIVGTSAFVFSFSAMVAIYFTAYNIKRIADVMEKK